MCDRRTDDRTGARTSLWRCGKTSSKKPFETRIDFTLSSLFFVLFFFFKPPSLGIEGNQKLQKDNFGLNRDLGAEFYVLYRRRVVETTMTKTTSKKQRCLASSTCLTPFISLRMCLYIEYASQLSSLPFFHHFALS